MLFDLNSDQWSTLVAPPPPRKAGVFQNGIQKEYNTTRIKSQPRIVRAALGFNQYSALEIFSGDDIYVYD